MRFDVLGPVRMVAGDEVLGPNGRLQAVLLGVLLAGAGELVPVSVLVDAMWDGERDPRVAQKLQFHVHRLRKVLGERALVSYETGAYQLHVDRAELDSARFVSLLREAERTTDPDRVVALLREGLGLWRGEPFEGLDVPVLADEALRLTELRLVAYDRMYQAELDRGRHAVVAAELAELSRAHPLREGFHRLLMIALHRGGRRAEALEVYREVRRALVDELGIEPGAELRAVEQQVLAGESMAPAARQTPVPAQLPNVVRDLVGRDLELSTLDEAVTVGEQVVTVVGTAGVGKTALVVNWGHRVRDRFPDGQLYVDLRGYGVEEPVSPSDALGGFLRALGAEGTAIPQETAERSARFRSIVAGRKMLLVLDNARSADQVRALLPGSPDVFVVVTSRDSLSDVAAAGARRVDLGRLSTRDAVALLSDLAGEEDTGEAIETLAELCARLPLALRIAAEQVSARSARGVADLVAELAEAPDRLDLLTVDEDPHAAVRGVFSWSYQQLPEPVARLFRLIGRHPGKGVDVHTLAAMAGDSLRDTRRRLDTLVRAHLVDHTTSGRYQPHDLLAVYAAELAETTDSPDEAAAALARLCDYYLHAALAAAELAVPGIPLPDPPTTEPKPALPTFPDTDRAFAWLRAEQHNLIATARRAAQDPASTFPMAISNTLRRYLSISAHLDDGLTLHTIALAVAERQGNLVEQGDALRGLAPICGRLGRNEEAIAHGKRALDAYIEAGDRRGETRALNALAVALGRAGRYDESNEYFERAADLHREAGELSQLGSVLSNIGANLLVTGDYERALAGYLEGLAIAEQLGDSYVECHTASNLAILYERMGRLPEAMATAEKAIEVARRSGNRLIEAEASGVLGTVHRRLGEHRRAFEYLDQALTLVESTEDGALRAETFNRRAEVHLDVGERDEARRCHEEAAATAAARAARIEQAAALAGLGDMAAHDGDFGQAREHWRAALELFAALGAPGEAAMRARLAATD